MRHAALCLAVICATAACGLPMENRAAQDVASAATGGADEAPLAVRPLQLSGAAKRYAVLGRRSRLDVRGHDSVLGDHVLSFDRWWAHIETEPARIVVDIDLTSLRSNEGLVESIVKNHMLEVDKYRHATLVGTLAETSRADRIVVDSVADIHGKQSPLRFTGKIRPEGDGYRFAASFDMSRRAFGLAYAPAELFLDDAFRISVDAVALPEHVTIED
ncbi:MAG: YceI-like domain [Myxococcaceae bacterium]|nr:YceI-like domain [Myxococcaceae bacterium]